MCRRECTLQMKRRLTCRACPHNDRRICTSAFVWHCDRRLNEKREGKFGKIIDSLSNAEVAINTCMLVVICVRGCSFIDHHVRYAKAKLITLLTCVVSRFHGAIVIRNGVEIVSVVCVCEMNSLFWRYVLQHIQIGERKIYERLLLSE
jgi:hypothetical protein